MIEGLTGGLLTHGKGKAIFKKYFEILIASKPYYLKQQGSYWLYPRDLSFSVIFGETVTMGTVRGIVRLT